MDEAGKAGAELRRLLIEEAAYRRRWVPRAHRAPRAGELSYAAVSEVLSDYLFDLAEDDAPSARAIRDRVRRALRGEVLGSVTLRWFVHAFDMTTQHAERLVGLRAGLGPDDEGWPAHWRELPPGGHRTRSLNELHDIGPERMPVRHRTVQVLEAEEDGFAVYPYRFDTPHAVVVVDEGGTAGPVYEVADGLWAVNIELSRPLARGETTTLVYETRFSYAEPPDPEFRRATRRRVDNVGFRIRFDPAAPPAGLWWGRWGLDGEVVHQEEVGVVDGTAHRLGDIPENSIVGFRWSWAPEADPKTALRPV